MFIKRIISIELCLDKLESARQTIKSTKVVVVIGDTEGVAYTALSGATRASDIGIDGEFPRNHLLEKVKSNV